MKTFVMPVIKTIRKGDLVVVNGELKSVAYIWRSQARKGNPVRTWVCTTDGLSSLWETVQVASPEQIVKALVQA